MFNEMSFIRSKFGPIGEIFSEVKFFGGPEISERFFVHFPEGFMLDRKNNIAIIFLIEERFRGIHNIYIRNRNIFKSNLKRRGIEKGNDKDNKKYTNEENIEL
tara:strand:+ start:899 stop:1207 length:309 start_codon:yes stop_codon:yes gene_type:complete